MRKFLLFGTMLGVASAAFAFGGVFGHGSKSSTYKGGVDAIGVHFGGKTPASIGINCPEHSSTQGDSPECVCDEGYEMTDSACKPIWPSTCAANDLYWCVETQTCVADKPACMAFCPEDRLCANGTTCCGQGNVCVDGNKCCYSAPWYDAPQCCDASESTGYSPILNDGDGGCCAADETAYVRDFESSAYTACCSNNKILTNLGRVSTCCNPGEIGYIRYEDGDITSGDCCDGSVHVDWEDEWSRSQFCCPKGTALMEVMWGHEEGDSGIQQLCCTEDKLYCADLDNEGGEEFCWGWECCLGEFVEENGKTICAPFCEDGSEAQRISYNNFPWIIPIDWTCDCLNGSRLYCDQWIGDEPGCAEPKCCPHEKLVTSFGYAAACCDANETPYCKEGPRWLGDLCRETACCPQGKVATQIDYISVCCDEGQEAHCTRYGEDNKCVFGACS